MAMIRVDDEVRDALNTRSLEVSVRVGRRVPLSDVIRELLGMELLGADDGR
jgi:hypothetical protein